VAVDKTLAVKIPQGIQSGRKHFAGLRSREGPAGEDQGEVFVGVFHYHVEVCVVLQLATAHLKHTNQVRMGKFASGLPSRELSVCVCGGCRDELDGRLLRLLLPLGEKHGAVVGLAQVAEQREFSIDDLALPGFPDLAHVVPRRHH